MVHFEAASRTSFAWLQMSWPCEASWAVTLPERRPCCIFVNAALLFTRESPPRCHAAGQVTLPHLCSSAGLLGSLTENTSTCLAAGKSLCHKLSLTCGAPPGWGGA